MADRSASPIAVITGASSGIGTAAAKALAAEGWQIIGVGRDETRSAAALAEIEAVASGPAPSMLRGDLSLLSEAERLAEEIAALTPRLDLLANNAGGMASEQRMTREGFEASFTANFLGPFLLTERLLPLLRKAAKDAPEGAVRIVNTSSSGSEAIPALDVHDLQGLQNWLPGRAYCGGKLANVLHARMLAERLADDGIIAHAFHPGTVDTNFFAHVAASVRESFRDAPKLSDEEGADTLIWLATAEEAGRTSGGYWYQREPRKPNPVVEDEAFVRQFWDASEAMIAKAGF